VTGFAATLARHRWWLCVAAGGGIYLVLPSALGGPVRAAIAWIVGVSMFLGWMAAELAGARPQQLRRLAREEDPRRAIVFAVTLAAALASLVAVAVLLRKAGDGGASSPLRIVLVGGVVVASWLLTHAMFAMHYAHGFYGDGPRPGPDDRGGLEFPGEHVEPDFLDFVYFSLVIGMTCQVSDVQITGRHMRRLASIHGLVSFFFNTVILAITVNLVVNAL